MKRYMPLSAVYMLLLTILLTQGSCRNRYYASSSFEEKTAKHKVIAVLPAEIVFTGTKPKKLTDEDIIKIEDAESRAFQESLYNNILRYANSRKYETRVDVQHYSTTLNRLAEKQLTARDSWKKNDDELAQLLGVDAVVRMTIEKHRYMSDMASYGITLGRQILTEIGSGGVLPGTGIPVPGVANKTNDIKATCSILSHGISLWNDHYKAAANWNNPANEIIEGITQNFGQNFPYKRRRAK